MRLIPRRRASWSTLARPSIQARSTAFQSVPHFHLHLIPRWTNDGKGFDWKEVPGNREEITGTADRIRAMFG